MIKTVLGTLLLSSALFGGTISIAVAANVSFAIDSLKKEFKKTNPKTNVRVTMGSSGKLTAQIMNGAPYSLFMSANMKYPRALYSSSNAISKPLVYAQGSLAYFSVKKRDFSNALELFQSEKISKIAIANPKTAPYGKAAFEALKNAKVLEKLRKKFVYGESISQTLSYATLAADVGIVAMSSLYSPKLSRFKKGVNWLEMDSTLYSPIDQGVVVLKNGANDPEVLAFYDFLFSDRAKKIFQEFGYKTP